MNLHVKCQIFLAKDDADAECKPLQSNKWMNLKGIAQDAKYSELCSFEIISKTELNFVRRKAFTSFQT